MKRDADRNNGLNSNGRDVRGRFAKGNPGKPRGARHRTTRAVEQLLDGQAEQLTERAVQLALEGDTTALRLCLERIAPPRKDAPIAFALPPVTHAEDIVDAGAALLVAVASGEVTPSEAQAVAALLQAQAKAIELHQLEDRVARLEKDRGT